jgi:simple sugar transport system permease protein
MIESLTLFLQTAVQTGTHILYAILGGILCEKVGNINLGIEGMMLMGASVGYFTAITSANPAFAVFAAGLAGSAGAMIYAVITVSLRGNQVVCGLILTIFGTGVSGFLGKSLAGKPLPETVLRAFSQVSVPLLSRIPVIGRIFFIQSPYVLTGILLAIVIYIYLNHSRFGLSTRSVGENPAVADASGINVTRYKHIHILAGGFLCGVGGAYLSLVFVPRWQENIIAGAGWIAVALIIFSTWNPLKAIFAAYVFGALKGVGFKFQSGFIPPKLLDMIPYVATIIVLVLITFRKRKEDLGPGGLGIPYFREER